MKISMILGMLCITSVHAAPEEAAAETEAEAEVESEPETQRVSGPVSAAAITPTRAEFRVPVQPQSVWAWNLGAPGVLEFAWLVEMPTAEGPVRFGVQVWHEEGAVPTKGSLEDLVSTGQSGVWPASATDGPARADLVVTASVEGNTVVIRIAEEASLTWLASVRPGMVKLLTQRGHGPRPEQRFQKEWSRMVPVVYRD